ncbi:MAG: hypothetical protein A4S09_09640 [Proteobacteria bacterium SG_bin7]|nr:MAG: hypothetical protein A4S09_09640 [Proteobacteria bacterium SG_bin7]
MLLYYYGFFCVLFLTALSGCNLSNGGELRGVLFTAKACPQNNNLNFFEEVRMHGDFLRSDCDAVAEALNDPALTAVTREFGPTIISLDKLPLKSDIAISPHKPWSSWWYPKREDFLFVKGENSTLGKYDSIRRLIYKRASRPTPGSALQHEQKSYNRNFAMWEGLCDAWAIASILKPEPRKPVKFSFNFSSLTFDVVDLKALLLKTFDAADESNLRYYGQKFTGSANSWIYPDIFPEQFHRLMEEQLFSRKQPFVMDHDAGVEVWNVPIYKANYQMHTIAGESNSVVVRTWIYAAEPTLPNDKNLVGTRETIREYNYVLKGNKNEHGELVVTSGYWIKGSNGVDSRRDHPDYLIRVVDPEKLVRKSWNPEIEVQIVDKILESAY